MKINIKKIWMLLPIIFIVGCGSVVIDKWDVIKTEGFIAYSSANYLKTLKKEDNVVTQPVVTELPVKEQVAEETKPEVKTPKKYLRLLTAAKGCGPCIRQFEIIIGSDWMIHQGTEKDNESRIPYHGLYEKVESPKDSANPLWEKYEAKSLPHWEVIEDGKKVRTYEGVLNKNNLRKFYLGERITDE